jgi:hypothetical protein
MATITVGCADPSAEDSVTGEVGALEGGPVGGVGGVPGDGRVEAAEVGSDSVRTGAR